MFVYFQNLSIKVHLKFKEHIKLFGTFKDTISKCPNIIRKMHPSQLLGCILAQVRSSNFWAFIIEHQVVHIIYICCGLKKIMLSLFPLAICFLFGNVKLKVIEFVKPND